MPDPVDVAEVETARAGARHAVNGGREVIREMAISDPRARGWARVTAGKACKFCTLLAGRGAVYTVDTVDFQAHDGCHCMPEPVFTTQAAQQGERPQVAPEPSVEEPVAEPSVPLTWEQFGAKLPTDSARRQLLNDALNKLNSLDAPVRERFVGLLGQFNGGINFRVATQSTQAIRELGKVTESIRVVGNTRLRSRSLTLHLSRQSDEWKEWVRARNVHVSETRELGRLMRDTLADSRPPADWPKNMAYLKYDELHPRPTQWRLATPDELADTLVHELGHANDFQRQVEAGAVKIQSTVPPAIMGKVREMYYNDGQRLAAYEYAKSEAVELIAELQKFYLRGVNEAETHLSALQWRQAHPDLAAWVEENFLQ